MTMMTTTRLFGAFLLVLAVFGQASAFLPTGPVQQSPLLRQQIRDVTASTTTHLNMFDPSSVMTMDSASMTTMMDSASMTTMMDSASTTTMMDSSSQFMSSMPSNMLSFADQGQNLAGIFFQASLLPYLLFLYFLSFRGNRISDIGNFGFQFILLFVASTIPSGIISKSVYGESLANVDWLHGGAETLLTIANILIVFGFKEAMTNPNPPALGKYRNLAFGTFGLFAAFCALGPQLGIQAHSSFLLGLGDLPAGMTASLPWVTHTEPVNALSIPTWIIHFSSVFEYLFAMNLVWQYAEVTGNEKWKGMTWGMLPLHISGVCACTYHFFYNPSTLQFLVSTQAGMTLLGNITCMIAAFRIARESGWSLDEVNPFPRSATSPTGLVADGVAAMPLKLTEAKESNAALAGKLLAGTVATSYLVKYGELGLDVPFTPNVPVSVAMILGFPAITAYYYANKSKQSEEDSLFEFLPGWLSGGDGDKPSLSMDDVKKYGVAGTVAYVLTELAFWAVAFPVASSALYQSTGHWPDVVNDTADRTAVLAFIFAGANIARAAVPLRFGAALALAPWVDENLINRGGKEQQSNDETVTETDTQSPSQSRD